MVKNIIAKTLMRKTTHNFDKEWINFFQLLLVIWVKNLTLLEYSLF